MRVARIEGTKAARTVTTIPIRKATTTVLAMTMSTWCRSRLSTPKSQSSP